MRTNYNYSLTYRCPETCVYGVWVDENDPTTDVVGFAGAKLLMGRLREKIEKIAGPWIVYDFPDQISFGIQLDGELGYINWFNKPSEERILAEYYFSGYGRTYIESVSYHMLEMYGSRYNENWLSLLSVIRATKYF